MFWIILAVRIAATAYALHYGYKLAFYYEDPLASPYEYNDDDQTRVCKAVLDAAIAEFKAVPFEEVSIRFHTVPGAGHALNYVTDPEGYSRVVREFTEIYL